MTQRAATELRGAHASRVSATASRRRELSDVSHRGAVAIRNSADEVRPGGTPGPARGTRALPVACAAAISDLAYA